MHEDDAARPDPNAGRSTLFIAGDSVGLRAEHDRAEISILKAT